LTTQQSSSLSLRLYSPAQVNGLLCRAPAGDQRHRDQVQRRTHTPHAHGISSGSYFASNLIPIGIGIPIGVASGAINNTAITILAACGNPTSP
jgi:hypothetical protein